MIAYKLLSLRKDGSIGPLFCNKKLRIPIGIWMVAEEHPTKGLAVRKGWHSLAKPYAPHLSTKGRRWYQVEIRNYREDNRPISQGGKWYISTFMKVIKKL